MRDELAGEEMVSVTFASDQMAISMAYESNAASQPHQYLLGGFQPFSPPYRRPTGLQWDSLTDLSSLFGSCALTFMGC